MDLLLISICYLLVEDTAATNVVPPKYPVTEELYSNLGGYGDDGTNLIVLHSSLLQLHLMMQ